LSQQRSRPDQAVESRTGRTAAAPGVGMRGAPPRPLRVVGGRSTSTRRHQQGVAPGVRLGGGAAACRGSRSTKGAGGQRGAGGRRGTGGADARRSSAARAKMARARRPHARDARAHDDTHARNMRARDTHAAKKGEGTSGGKENVREGAARRFRGGTRRAAHPAHLDSLCAPPTPTTRRLPPFLPPTA